MEGGNVGATTNGRPIRSASRYYTNSTANFSGPVRRWEKKWVHVAPSQPSSSTKTTRSKPFLSNANKLSAAPILLRKWTPLSQPPPTTTATNCRKFRYTPIAVVKEKKKVTTNRLSSQDFEEETRQSGKRLAMTSDGSYGILDINKDPSEEAYQGVSKSDQVTQYSRRGQQKHEAHTETGHGFWLMN